MFGTERILKSNFRRCIDSCSELLADQDCREVSGRGMDNTVTHFHYRFCLYVALAHIQTLAGYGTMVVKKRSGL